MRAGLRAGRDEGDAVPHVRTHGRDDHPGAPCEVGDRRLVEGVEDDERPLRGRPGQVAPDRLESLGGPARQGDPQPLGRVLGEVAGDEPPGEPGGAEEDDVELASRVGHRPNVVAGPQPVVAG